MSAHVGNVSPGHGIQFWRLHNLPISKDSRVMSKYFLPDRYILIFVCNENLANNLYDIFLILNTGTTVFGGENFEKWQKGWSSNLKVGYNVPFKYHMEHRGAWNHHQWSALVICDSRDWVAIAALRHCALGFKVLAIPTPHFRLLLDIIKGLASHPVPYSCLMLPWPTCIPLHLGSSVR